MIFGLGKPVTCQRCGVTIEKKQENIFDSTIRGKKKDGETLTLCGNCLMEKFGESLARFKFRAVVVYPQNNMGWNNSDANAYQFYTLKEMSDYHWTDDYIAALHDLLPPAGTRCSTCGAAASFTWVSPKMYFNDWSSSKINTKEKYEKTFVCGRCLLQEFRKKFLENHLKFDEFLPPVDGDSFGTPFEV